MSRGLVCIGAAALAIGLVWYCTHVAYPGRPTDFDQVWVAARATLEGRDAYAEIGPGRAFEWPWRYLYPLTASATILPLVPLPLEIARYAFAGASAALLAWGVTRNGWHYLPLFLDSPFVVNALADNWSALLTAGLTIPALAWLFAAKPNMALLLVSRLDRRTFLFAITGTLAVLAVSLVLAPGWIPRWIATTRQSAGTLGLPIITVPGGFLVLLTLLRWRRSDARLTVALACCPMTAWHYSYLPLALVAETRMQSLVLAILSWAAFVLPALVLKVSPGVHSLGELHVIFLLCFFAPAVWLILRRPNVA